MKLKQFDDIDPFGEEDWEETEDNDDILRLPIIMFILFKMRNYDIKYHTTNIKKPMKNLKISEINGSVNTYGEFTTSFSSTDPHITLTYANTRSIDIYPYYRNNVIRLYITYISGKRVLHEKEWYDVNIGFEKNTNDMIKFLKSGVKSKIKSFIDKI